MYTILAFDNRSLDSDASYSNLDLETDGGMNSYQKLSARMILQSFIAADEVGQKRRLSCILLPTSFEDVRSIFIDDATSTPYMQENLKSSHSLLTHANVLSDSWTGLFTNILKAVERIQTTTTICKDTPINLIILTQDVALFGYKYWRQVDEESVHAFASELKVLKEQTRRGVNVKMVCFNISSSLEQDYTLDQLRLKSEKIIHNELLNTFTLPAYSRLEIASSLTSTSNFCSVFSLSCMDNSIVYYESVLRTLILSTRKLFVSRLIFPKTSLLEAFVEVELTPYSLSAMKIIHPGLTKLHSVRFMSNVAIAADNIDGNAISVRPVEIDWRTPKARSNVLLFLALNRILIEESSVLLIRAEVFALEDDLHAISYDQYWMLLPSSTDATIQMTMLKLVDNEDLLQDGANDSRKNHPSLQITAAEDVEIKRLQNGLMNMFLENADVEGACVPYNPLIYSTKRFDSLIHASLQMAKRQQAFSFSDRSSQRHGQERRRAAKTKSLENMTELNAPQLQLQSATKDGGVNAINIDLRTQRDRPVGGNKKSTAMKSSYNVLPSTRTQKRRRAKTLARSLAEFSSSDDDFIDEPR